MNVQGLDPLRSLVLLVALVALLVLGWMTFLDAPPNLVSAPPSPAATAVLGAAETAAPAVSPTPIPERSTPVGTAPAVILSPTLVPPVTPEAPKPSPTAAAPGSSGSLPTVSAPAQPELSVIAQGFGQAQQKVGYAIVVQNTSREMVTDRTGSLLMSYSGSGGAVLQTVHGDVGVVLPGQQQGVAGTFSVPAGARVERIVVTVAPASFVFPWTSTPLPLSTTDLAVRTVNGLSTVAGEVRNPDAVGFGAVVVSAIVYNDAHAIIGGGSTTAGALAPNGRASIEVPITTSAPPVQVELFAAPRTVPAVH